MENVRTIVENAEIRSCLYLVKNGVPFDVAFSLPEHEVMAWTIIFGQFDGGKWDWANGCWIEDK